MRINLIYHDNGAGLPRDARIISELLAPIGAELTHSPLRAPALRQRLSARASKWSRRPRYDLNIFLEQPRPSWLPFAQRNLLVPNQEWFSPAWIDQLPNFDLVLCKTREAESRFRVLGAAVRYIGFTAADHRLGPEIPALPGALHIAGRSVQKGTVSVLRVWRRHPDWPTLIVVQRPPHPGHQLWHPPIPNVVYHSGYLSDARIRELQNAYRLHVRPSEAEGFGHPFGESLSCGVVMVTTDAPPMNELVRPDRGLLVPAVVLGPQGIGMAYRVDEVALEETITRALSLPPEERARMGENARAWFERNQEEFRERLVEAVLRH
jgi:glycosyltransferase involved in cell wall biosynthesis